MKTATVRDLRNNFGNLAKWIEHGEQIAITRHGKSFATLSPSRAKRQVKVDWAAHFAKHPPLGRKLTAKETDEFWSKLRD